MNIRQTLKKSFLVMAITIMALPFVSWTSDINDSSSITSIPYFEILEAVSFQNIHQEGDLLFIAKINLDEDGQYVLNNTNYNTSQNFCNLTSSDCSTTPIVASSLSLEKDLFTQQHPLNINYVECSGSGNCQNSSGNQTVMISSIVKRIDYSLISLYKSSQTISGINYGDTSGYLCLSPNATVFPSNSEKCLQIEPLGSLSGLSSYLVTSVRGLQTDLELDQYTLINSNSKITNLGVEYVNLAVPSFSQIASKSEMQILEFQMKSFNDSNEDYTEKGLALTQSLQDEYEATKLDENVTYLMGYTFGIDSGSYFWQFFFIILSVCSVFFFFFITRNGFFSLFSGVMAYSLSIFVIPTNVPIMFSGIALASLLMGSWLVKRMGQN